MKQIQLFVYPYWKIRGASTELWADQKKMLPTDSRFAALLAGAGPAQWLRPYREGYSLWKGFLAELVEEFNDDEFHIRYCGRTCDFLEITGECRLQADALKRNRYRYGWNGNSQNAGRRRTWQGGWRTFLSMVEKLGLARRKDLRWGRTREELAYDRANQSLPGNVAGGCRSFLCGIWRRRRRQAGSARRPDGSSGKAAERR